MDKITLTKYINRTCYFITIIECFLFNKLRKTNYSYAILSLQILLLMLIIICIIPILFKTLPKKKKTIQIIFVLFLLVEFLITLYL